MDGTAQAPESEGRPSPRSPLRWDVFCHVVDNHGDLGVCWRLATDLAGRGHTVRLWIDDAGDLVWLAPDGCPGVEVRRWDAAAEPMCPPPGDVVIEAFGCDPPSAFVQAMARRVPAPVWINLEYLTAEPYAERCHGLPSPQAAGAGVGLVKWFFFPGFGLASGGLLREPGLLERQRQFESRSWLSALECAPQGNERVVSLFCYDNPALPTLIDLLSDQPTLLLATAGHAAAQAMALLGASGRRGPLRCTALPFLPQSEFDHLLWSCDLNFVRGEDSFVRAQWAGRPFVWQAYPQQGDAHVAKLHAYTEAFWPGQTPTGPVLDALRFRRWSDAWNGAAPLVGDLVLPDADAWTHHCLHWRTNLLRQPDLVTRLVEFVARHAGVGGAGL